MKAVIAIPYQNGLHSDPHRKQGIPISITPRSKNNCFLEISLSLLLLLLLLLLSVLLLFHKIDFNPSTTWKKIHKSSPKFSAPYRFFQLLEQHSSIVPLTKGLDNVASFPHRGDSRPWKKKGELFHTLLHLSRLVVRGLTSQKSSQSQSISWNVESDIAYRF